MDKLIEDEDGEEIKELLQQYSEDEIDKAIEHFKEQSKKE